MSLFWAKFEKYGNDIFRLDTRIYLDDIKEPNIMDKCIGAVVGKNPGSAKRSNNSASLQAIDLNGDKLLPTVKNIIQKAYQEANINPPKNAYIQVLNLFYLCNKNLDEAIVSMKNSQGPKTCKSEEKIFPWIWYVWGGQANTLDSYKKRFFRMQEGSHFFYDKNNGKIQNNVPNIEDFAKHTQGLSHDCMVPYIATLLS